MARWSCIRIMITLMAVPPVAFYVQAALCEIWDSMFSEQSLVGCCALTDAEYHVISGAYTNLSLLRLNRDRLLVPVSSCKISSNDSVAVLPHRGLWEHDVLSLAMPRDSFTVYQRAHDCGYVVCKDLPDKVTMQYVTALFSVGTLVLSYVMARFVISVMWLEPYPEAPVFEDPAVGG